MRGSPSRWATIPPRKAATRISAMSPAIPTPLFYTITPAMTRNGTKGSVSSEHQDLGSYLAFLYTQQSEGVLRLPAFVGRAAGVEEQEAIVVLQKGDVRVSEDDYTRLGKATCQTPAAALSTARVVDHAYSGAAEAKLQGLEGVHLRRGYCAPDGARGVLPADPSHAGVYACLRGRRLSGPTPDPGSRRRTTYGGFGRTARAAECRRPCSACELRACCPEGQFLHLLHKDAAVDVEGLARYVVPVHDQVADSFGDISRFADPTERYPLPDPLPHVIGDEGEHVGLYKARTDSVHLYVVAGRLQGGGLRKPYQARLGRRVVSLAEVTRLTHEGAHVDDVAALLLDKVRQGGLHRIVAAVQVHLDDSVPLLDG